MNDVLDKLNAVLRENELLEKQLKERTRQLEIKEKDLKYQKKVLEEKKANLLEDVDEIKEQLILDAKKEIDKVINLKNNPNIKVSELIKSKSKLDELVKEEVNNEPIEVKIGDYVSIPLLGVSGRVTSISKNKVEIISSDGMKYKTSIDKLEHSEAPRVRKIAKSNVDDMIRSRASLKMELNIIGQHVDEAMENVAKYLDDARIANYKEVRIIHGMGTGALKDAVHDYLDSCNFVSEYHLGGEFDGRSGATIVKLK